MGAGMNAERVLRDAARYIRVNGWCRGFMGGETGPRCMLGALYSVGVLDLSHEQSGRMDDALSEVINLPITAFNDHHCKTVDDAIAALEIAADLAA